MLRQIQALLLKNFQLAKASWMEGCLTLLIIPIISIVCVIVIHLNMYERTKDWDPKQQFAKNMFIELELRKDYVSNYDILCDVHRDSKILDTRPQIKGIDHICVDSPTQNQYNPRIILNQDEFDDWYVNRTEEMGQYCTYCGFTSGIEFHNNGTVITGLYPYPHHWELSNAFGIMLELAKREAKIKNKKNILNLYNSPQDYRYYHEGHKDEFMSVYHWAENYTQFSHKLSHGALAVIIVFGLTISMVSALSILKQERRDKVLTLMRLNGLKLTEYFLSHIIFWTFVGFLQVLIICLSLCWHPILTYWAIVVPILILHVLSTSILSLLLNLVLPNNIFSTFFTVILVAVISSSGVYWYPFTRVHHGAFYLIPLVGTSTILSQCYYRSAADLPIGNVLDTSSLKAAFALEFINPIIYILIVYYFYHLSNASGSESRKKWYFPIVSSYRYIIKWWSGREIKSKESVPKKNEENPHMKVLSVQDGVSDIVLSTSEIDSSSLLFSADGRPYTPVIGNQDVDPDVKREADNAFRVTSDTHSLILRKVTKTYSDGKTAVSDVSFAVENGLVFGLLGPNGAGKSTLLNAMSGVHKHSSGEIIINGYDMNINLQGVLDNIGYCPQHDIYWRNLTVEQHLLLFLRLKGIKSDEEEERLLQLLALVSLGEKRKLLASKLSGGEKRRLSIAMAFCGKGKVIFLDEPTTGLDPEVRKFVWNVIMGVKKDRLVILTTHSMEEAEVLSDKIAIMAKGTLRCFGTPQYLKSKFGGKTIINISAPKDVLVHATSAIVAIRRDQISVISQSSQSAKLEYGGPKQSLPDLFESIEDLRTKIGFEDWGFDQPSLNEVFVRIVTEAEASA